MGMGKSKFQPMTWEQNPDLQIVIDYFSQKFENFNENQQKIATHEYIEFLVNKPVKGMSSIDKLQAFAPSAKDKGISLLHPDVVQSYFEKFNNELKHKQKSLKEKSDAVDAQKELEWSCRI